MKVLVTGATGFIGTHLVKALVERGDEVVCLVRDRKKIQNAEHIHKISVIERDLSDDITGICRHMDVVVHLAAQLGAWGAKQEQFQHLNIQILETLLMEVKQSRIKQFVFCSTPGVTGMGKRQVPEDAPYHPRGMYEKSKVAGEKIVQTFCRENQLDFTIVRPDFVYGPGDGRRISLFKTIKNGTFILPVSGSAYIHPTYFEDIIQGFLLIIGNSKAYGEVFNLAAEHDVTVYEFLDTIAQLQGVKLKRVFLPFPVAYTAAACLELMLSLFLKKEPFVTTSKVEFLAKHHSSEINKAKRILDYKPKVDVKRGLAMTLDWIKSQKLY